MKFSALKGHSIWISGASSGIGLQMALIAARAGASLFLISSREEALKAAAEQCLSEGAAAVHIAVADLSDISTAAETARKRLSENDVPDYLILNAGVSQRSLAAETDIEVTQYILNINFLSAVAITRTVLPAMLHAGKGHIGVTSSLVGDFGFPLRSAYSASKKALHGYFESVDLEYRGAGIYTTLALPGRIRTSISINALEGDGSRNGKMDPGQLKGLDSKICAERYWRAVIRGRRHILIGGSDRIMVFFHRFIPPLFRSIARRVSSI